MKKIYLPIELFQETQKESMCGPASLKIVLDYYGVHKTEAELAKLCKSTVELGTSAEGMKAGAEALGFLVEVKERSTFEDIERWLQKKVPVIVDWFTRGMEYLGDSDVPDGHYSVVAGLDDDFIYLQDPELGRVRRMRRQDFMRAWFDFKGQHIEPDSLVIREIIAVYPARGTVENVG